MTLALVKTVACLRQLAARPALSERNDRQLLDAFAQTGDENAFAQVVQRHGELVLGVCRRVLGNADDADDAFQATFLVLARKAGRIGWHDSVRNWLYGVAYRIARKARAMQARRRLKESQANPPQAVSALESAWSELRGVLDEELHNLPARYRAPLLLCYFDGKTREEAAMLLRWSVGSVKGRLERGRELLRERLRCRGLTLPAVLCTGLLAQGTVSAALVATATSAAVPFAAGNVAAATSPIAVQLAQGALQAMLIAKCKITGLVLTLTCALGVGGSVAVHHAWADRPTAATHATSSIESRDLTVLDPVPISFQEKEPNRRDEKEREKAARGIFKSVDEKVGTITIQSVRDGERGEKTYNLGGKDIKVLSNLERPLKLADLREGMIVSLVLKENDDVAAIRVEMPVIPAIVLRADKEKKTITIRQERTGETTLKVADDVKVTYGEKTIALTDLDANQGVLLQLSADKQTVLAIRAGITRRDEARPGAGREVLGREREGRLSGVIVELDAAKNSIGLLVGREGNLSIQTLTLAKDAKVRLMHGDRPLSDLTVAQLGKAVQAWVTLSEDQKTVTALDVAAPVMRLRVKSVDAAARKLTVGAERMELHTYELAADVKIQRGRTDVQLADLQPGTMLMLALSLDRSKVIAATVIGDGERER